MIREDLYTVNMGDEITITRTKQKFRITSIDFGNLTVGLQTEDDFKLYQEWIKSNTPNMSEWLKSRKV